MLSRYRDTLSGQTTLSCDQLLKAFVALLGAFFLLITEAISEGICYPGKQTENHKN